MCVSKNPDLSQVFIQSSINARDPLQKQIGCFNRRVITMVTDQLKKQWLCIVYFSNCIRQPGMKFPRPSYKQDLADIVTAEHVPGESPAFYQKHLIFEVHDDVILIAEGRGRVKLVESPACNTTHPPTSLHFNDLRLHNAVLEPLKVNKM